MPLELALKKIREQAGTNLEHFISAFATDLLLTQAIAYDGSNQTEYIGYALPGSSKAAPIWLIKKLTYSGSLVTDIQFAGGEAKFNQIWDDRAGLSFS